MADSDAAGIPLQGIIKTLREQLMAGIRHAETEDLTFGVDAIDLELQVGVSDTAGVDGGIGFSIFKFGGKVEAKAETVQKLRLTLRPRYRGFEGIEVADEVPEKPDVGQG